MILFKYKHTGQAYIKSVAWFSEGAKFNPLPPCHHKTQIHSIGLRSYTTTHRLKNIIIPQYYHANIRTKLFPAWIILNIHKFTSIQYVQVKSHHSLLLNSSAPRSKQTSFVIEIFSKSEGCMCGKIFEEIMFRFTTWTTLLQIICHIDPKFQENCQNRRRLLISGGIWFKDDAVHCRRTVRVMV